MADFLEDLTGKKLPPMMKKVIEICEQIMYKKASVRGQRLFLSFIL